MSLDENFRAYQEISQLGPLVPLRFMFPFGKVSQELEELSDKWIQYNPSKPEIRRSGISLTSLDGRLDDGMDLDSILEYNERNGTSYDEMSFRTPTPAWEKLKTITDQLEPIRDFIGRSHIIRLQPGGFFPPHRDLGEAFRLCAFFNVYGNEFVLGIDGEHKSLMSDRLYFMDVKKEHYLFSMIKDVYVLVLNVLPCEETKKFVIQNLLCR